MLFLQSSYAGAYLEDKLNFYNRHMEKYGQFAGKLEITTQLIPLLILVFRSSFADFDTSSSSANGSSLDCLNLIVQSINKSTTSALQIPISGTGTGTGTGSTASASGNAAITKPASSSLHANFKKKCST